MYVINFIIIYDMVNLFSIKMYKSSRKLRVGVNRYTGVNWSTTTTLSNTNPLKCEAEYLKLKEIWSTQGMQTFKGYLVNYNNLDIGPFATTLSSFLSIYSQQKIDIFKDYVALPGVARKLLYASTESNFSLINQQNADLYYTYGKNIVGGPSIIFSHYHEKGVFNIKK